MTAGDPLTSLDATYMCHRPAALALARRILGDAHLAEDAVQLAFVQILVRVRSGDATLLDVNPRAVVLRGTRWAALKLAERDRDRHAGQVDDTAVEDLTDPWERVEARLISRDIVASLPAHYRDALTLRYVEDQPDDSAAARLALTVKAYRRRLDRALVAARSTAVRLGSGAAGGPVGLVAPRVRLLVRGAYMRTDSRVRQVRARVGMPGGSPGFSHITVVVAIAGISAAATLGPLGGDAPKPPAIAQTGALALSGSQEAPVATAGAAAGPQVGGANATGTALPPPRPPVHSTPTPGTASALAAPAPSQVYVDQVMPADSYETSHVVVMSATVPSCQCSALYRSDDGGGTWNGRLVSQPVGGVYALPPHYPDDPRILHAEGQVTCLMPTIDAATCTPIPLYGSVAFDADFDSGHPEIYGEAASNHGFLAYNVQTGNAQPILLGAALTSLGTFTPRGDTVAGVYLVAELGAGGGVGFDGYGPPALFFCDGQLHCSQKPSSWAGVLSYNFDRLDTTGLMLGGSGGWAGAAYAVSFDGGNSQAFTIPGPVGSGNRFALIGGSRDLAVLQVSAGRGSSTVTRWRPDRTSESLAPLPGVPANGDAFVPVPVTPLRWFAYEYANLGNQSTTSPGYLCTTDGGQSWQRSCAPDA